jgi:hypothetical protein
MNMRPIVERLREEMFIDPLLNHTRYNTINIHFIEGGTR